MKIVTLVAFILLLFLHSNIKAQTKVADCVYENVNFNETALINNFLVKYHVVPPIDSSKYILEFRYYMYSVYSARGSMLIIQYDLKDWYLTKIEYWYNKYFIGKGWNEVGKIEDGRKVFVKKDFAKMNSFCQYFSSLQSNNLFLLTPDFSVPPGQKNTQNLWYEIKYFNKFRSVRYPLESDEADKSFMNNIDKLFFDLYHNTAWKTMVD